MSIDEYWAFAFGVTIGGIVVSLGLLAWDVLSMWWGERKEAKEQKHHAKTN